MARVNNQDHSLRHGKLSKSSPIVYRVRNGKQQSYTPNDTPQDPSPAQKAHRKFFGKITTLVNAIVADPQQNELWDAKRIAYNHSVALDPTAKRYKTVRSYAHAVLSEQLANSQSTKRRRKPIPKALPKGLKLHVKTFSELSTTELYEIIKSRFNVFYLEQHIFYPDLDDIDYLATHFALFRKGHVIAYARLIPGLSPEEASIGRLLSIERGKGFGKYIMQQIELSAQTKGIQSLTLHAQTQTVPFYESLGYKPIGDIFQEAGISHILMKKSLS